MTGILSHLIFVSQCKTSSNYHSKLFHFDIRRTEVWMKGSSKPKEIICKDKGTIQFVHLWWVQPLHLHKVWLVTPNLFLQHTLLILFFMIAFLISIWPCQVLHFNHLRCSLWDLTVSSSKNTASVDNFWEKFPELVSYTHQFQLSLSCY